MVFNPKEKQDVGGFGGNMPATIWREAMAPILTAQPAVPFPPADLGLLNGGRPAPPPPPAPAPEPADDGETPPPDTGDGGDGGDGDGGDGGDGGGNGGNGNGGGGGGGGDGGGGDGGGDGD
jgi:hypothetical protein